MLSIKKILLPVDFPVSSVSVIRQAATMARHFQAEIVMLHTVTPVSHDAGVPEDPALHPAWNLLTAIVQSDSQTATPSLQKDLQGLMIKSLVVQGDPALAIVQTTHQQPIDLIMMPSHGFTFYQYLLGSVTGKVLHETNCPVWTGAHTAGQAEPVSDHPFAIRNVLCAVDLGPRSEPTIQWAADIATEFGATLTLAHATASVELYVPGGSYVQQDWKEALVGDATERLARLQQSLGTHANVFIDNGDVPKTLKRAAIQSRADLLVTGSSVNTGHILTHGYAIVCAVPIPVLNV